MIRITTNKFVLKIQKKHWNIINRFKIIVNLNMPRGKNKQKNEQKKQIEIRLMQINLLIEDYVYKQTPISWITAEKYIEEIIFIKNNTCHSDKRSLQVIEKQLRCFRGIIEEQREKIPKQSSYNATQHLEHPPLPPLDIAGVFPAMSNEDNTLLIHEQEILTQCDEDLIHIVEDMTQFTQCSIDDMPQNIDDFTQMTQDILDFPQLTQNLESNVVDTEQKMQSNIFSSNMNLTRDYHLDKETSIVVDLCENDNDIQFIDPLTDGAQPNTESEHTVAYIEKAISNIRLANVENINSNNSQSILEGFDTVNENNQIITRATFVSNVKTINAPKENTKSTISNTQYCRSTVESSTPGILFTPTPRTVTNKTLKVSSIGQKDTTIKKYPKRRNSTNRLNATKQTKTSSNVNDLEITKSKLKNTKTKTQSQTKTNKRNKNTVKDPAIYSRSVINDLSWIENIRYVREIAEDEYDSIQTPTGFWDNYTIPKNWNDDDFKY